jgi:hypothetical protein
MKAPALTSAADPSRHSPPEREKTAAPYVLVGTVMPWEQNVLAGEVPYVLGLRVPAEPEWWPKVRDVVRRHLADVFAADPEHPTPDLRDEISRIVLVLAELFSNGARNKRAEGSTLDIEVACDRMRPGSWGSTVRVSVRDDNPDLPPAPPPLPKAEELAAPAPDPELLSDPQIARAVIESLDERRRGLLLVRENVGYLDVVPDGDGKTVRALMTFSRGALAVEHRDIADVLREPGRRGSA